MQDPRAYTIRKGSQQRPPPKSVRPPLIPNEEEYETSEEGFFVSIGKLLVYSGSAFADIFGGLFSGGSRSKRKALHYQNNRHPSSHHHHVWPVQESFVIPDEDDPPPPCLETRTPTPRKASSYPYMSQHELDKLPPQQHLKQTRAYLSSTRWDDHQQHHQHQQKQPHQHHQAQHQQIQAHYSSTTHHPQAYYEPNRETNEIVFGAVQEQDGRREAMVIKAVDYGDPKYSSHHNLRPRLNYVGYNSHGY